MVKFTILYDHPEDPDAFERYYAEVHMPLVRPRQQLHQGREHLRAAHGRLLTLWLVFRS
jgi:uncharacterized protein (TIGR02118 family)